MGDVSDNFSFASNDFRALGTFFRSWVTPEQPRPLSVGAHGEPRARVPHLVASRLPRHYHFRALIQSFQAVAAPFPGDSILRPGSLALRSQRPKRLGSKDRRSADYVAAWDLRNLFRHPASAAPPISRDRRRGWTRPRDFFRFGETVARRCHRRPPNEDDSAGFQFDFVCFQWFARRKSFPPLPARAASPALGPLRRAREGEHSGNRVPPCDVRPRASGAIARPRRSPRADDDSACRRSTSGGGVSGRAWPRRILVIGGRTRRVA
jgi:hypothetical protein